MKKSQIKWVVIVWLAAQSVMASVPMPAVTYYGLIRDEYGHAYTENVEMFAWRGTNECYKYEVTGLRAVGVNYQIEIEMDSGGTRYAPYAVQTGETLDLIVEVLGQQKPLSPISRIIVPEAGKTVRLDLVTGIDSDGDGLPDAWEQLLISQSGGTLATLEDVKPTDDFDGDGMNNRDEFFSGTFPFLAFDRLAIDDLEQTPDGRMKFTFLTVAGKGYSIRSTTNVAVNAWVDQPFAITAAGEADINIIIGNGEFKTLYIDTDREQQFIKLLSQ